MATPLQPPPRKWGRTQKKRKKKKKKKPPLKTQAFPTRAGPTPAGPLPLLAPPALLLFAFRIPSTRSNDLFVSSPWKFHLPSRTICPARFRWSIKMRNCPTVRVGSAASIKTQNRRRTDGQTHCCNYIRDVQLYHPLDVFVYHIPWIVKNNAILWHKGSFHYIMKCFRFNKTFSFILFLTFVFIFSFKTTSLLGFWWHHNMLFSKPYILMCKTNLSPWVLDIMNPQSHINI